MTARKFKGSAQATMADCVDPAAKAPASLEIRLVKSDQTSIPPTPAQIMLSLGRDSARTWEIGMNAGLMDTISAVPENDTGATATRRRTARPSANRR